MGVNPEKTPKELAEIAYLDKLRTCEGEAMPTGGCGGCPAAEEEGRVPAEARKGR